MNGENGTSHGSVEKATELIMPDLPLEITQSYGMRQSQRNLPLHLVSALVQAILEM